MSTVEFERLTFHDSTGFATHLLVELGIRRATPGGATVETVPRTLALQDGRAFLSRPGLEQVFAIALQPVIAEGPNRRQPLGPPVTHSTSPGSFLRRVHARTTGTLIQRTVVDQTLAGIPVHGTHAPAALRAEDAAHGFAFEVFGGQFEYQDLYGGDAEMLTWTIVGVKGGTPGTFEIHQEVQMGRAKLDTSNFEDITQVAFQPYQDPARTQPYGAPASISASPGAYLTQVKGETTTRNPVSNQITDYAERTPFAARTDGGEPPFEIAPAESPPPTDADRHAVPESRVPAR